MRASAVGPAGAGVGRWAGVGAMRLDTGGAADTGDSAGVDAAGLLRAPLGRLRRRWAVCGVSGPPEASRGALLWAAHRRSERPTAALDAPSTALKPSAALRPAVALDGAPLGRLRHRWAVCGTAGPPEASRGALLWAAHRRSERPTAALDAPSGLMRSPPTMAAPAFPSSSPPERCRGIAVEASGSDRQAHGSGDGVGGVDEAGSTGPVAAHSARLSGLEPAEPPGSQAKTHVMEGPRRGLGRGFECEVDGQELSRRSLQPWGSHERTRGSPRGRGGGI